MTAPFPEITPLTADVSRRPVTETAERFLRAILDTVPVDRVVDLHLFAPLRQGVSETGVAVVAAWPEDVARPESVGAVVQLPLEGVAEALADVPEPVETVDSATAVDAVDEADQADEADEAVEADQADEAQPPVDPRPRHRHTVYTARYRAVVKGPERGKWDVEVVAEAEAPLITVDAVVRGVQRRAGDDAEPLRYDAPSLRHILRLPDPVSPVDPVNAVPPQDPTP